MQAILLRWTRRFIFSRVSKKPITMIERRRLLHFEKHAWSWSNIDVTVMLCLDAVFWFRQIEYNLVTFLHWVFSTATLLGNAEVRYRLRYSMYSCIQNIRLQFWTRRIWNKKCSEYGRKITQKVLKMLYKLLAWSEFLAYSSFLLFLSSS